MNIIPKNIDKKYIYYFEPVKNNIMDSGRFIRVGYSDTIVNLNGIYTLHNLKVKSINRYFNKITYTFDYNDNMCMLDYLIDVESYILSNVSNDTGLEPIYNLREQLLSQTIRVYNNDTYSYDMQNRDIEILVKISGIWVTDIAYGLTFKFYNVVKT